MRLSVVLGWMINVVGGLFGIAVVLVAFAAGLTLSMPPERQVPALEPAFTEESMLLDTIAVSAVGTVDDGEQGL